MNLATLRQIHSNQVLVATKPGDLGEADAMITNEAGVTLTIRTADCLPILMADTRNHAVAAIHAGWRGVVLEIVPATLEAMANRFGTRAEDLIVAIGPGICERCYEVGSDVAARFTRFFPERNDLTTRTKIDLAETIHRQLRRNGGTLGQIDPSGLCTYCRADLFYSYRRQRHAAGRMLTSIRIL
ncbi:MAG TPA: peptidoglycan editing factor PgeF [Bryobacteraceae bacterium]|nr:peptidoglycan editing factor PgeF [Bryobacteraceae bacterium]